MITETKKEAVRTPTVEFGSALGGVPSGSSASGLGHTRELVGGGWKISIGELAVLFTFSEFALLWLISVPFSVSEGLSLRLKLFLGPARPARLQCDEVEICLEDIRGASSSFHPYHIRVRRKNWVLGDHP